MNLSADRTRPAPARVPLATYRLQFNRDFNFRRASEITEYLSDLGVSDAYASPLFQAGPQSTHGYDICGFHQLSPTLGSPGDFAAFSGGLRERGLGLLLDMVPNHMGADLSNAWWVDVLEKGEGSRYAHWFDIDWLPPNPALHHKVLLPVLEELYAKVLESGKLQLRFEQGSFGVAYYQQVFPLSPAAYSELLEEVFALGGENLGPGEVPDHLRGSLDVLTGFRSGKADVQAEFEKVKGELRDRYAASAPFATGISEVLKRYNGSPGAPASFDPLDRLLREQHYRLAYWRIGSEEINYRRFFDVTGLVSLRMELPEVFNSSHELLLGLVRTGQVTGLRIDHPDGLWDPKQYCQRLRRAAPGIFVVVEKILMGDERLPGDWPVEGTTGYDFLNRLNGIFVDSSHRDEFDRIYREFTGCDADFATLVSRSKQKILRLSLVSELNALAHRLKRIAGSTRYGVDFTLEQIREALTEVIAAFPVYRTYISEGDGGVSTRDAEVIAKAIRIAKSRGAPGNQDLLSFVEELLLLRPPADLNKEVKLQAREFVMKLQQLTGPAMAKGLEDTAFYNFNRLVSLNDVGGDPGAFGVTLEQFHAHNAAKAEQWPHSLLATATHDTKRGEDVRARLNVLSELPEEWQNAVNRWAGLNAVHKSIVNDQPAPHPNDEYLLYQTLVGTWLPEHREAGRLENFRQRISAYLLKALKEAKTFTSWTEPNAEYEQAAARFVERLLADTAGAPFLDDFETFQSRVAFFGRFNSLSQTLLKLASPGVPDIYQGTELWDFSLVDPDNRRPVDYELRRHLLAGLRESMSARPVDMMQFLNGLLAEPGAGRIKLYLIWRTLQFRCERRELFAQGTYAPLAASGSKMQHVCAFARAVSGGKVIVVAPRLVARLARGKLLAPIGAQLWQDTRLELPQANPGDQWQNVLTGETVVVQRGGLAVSEVLHAFPVALLHQ